MKEYVLIHRNEYGDDAYRFFSNTLNTYSKGAERKLVEYFEINFEPDLEEELILCELTNREQFKVEFTQEELDDWRDHE
jgi:hypothetical protein